MFVKALEHFKCDELTRAPCRSQQRFDVFDHFLKVKVAETPPPPRAIMLDPQNST